MVGIDDEHRVQLAPLPGHPDCQTNYINACYVDVSELFALVSCGFNSVHSPYIQGCSIPNKFLATQGIYFFVSSHVDSHTNPTLTEFHFILSVYPFRWPMMHFWDSRRTAFCLFCANYGIPGGKILHFHTRGLHLESCPAIIAYSCLSMQVPFPRHWWTSGGWCGRRDLRPLS